MTANPDQRLPPRGSVIAASHERLLETISGACDPRAEFVEQVEASLRATLTFLSADPERARLLTVEPYGADEGAASRHQHWLERYGELLRHAAENAPEVAVQPHFVEPTIAAGLCWQISRRVADGQVEHLQRLLPGLLEFTLVFYLEADEAARLARATAAPPAIPRRSHPRRSP